MAKKEKDERSLSMQDLRGAMAEEHPERDAGLSAMMVMSSDTVEEQQPEGTYRFALNGVMEDRETTGMLQNEESNEECIDITGDNPTEYTVYATSCCNDHGVVQSSDIADINSFILSFLFDCDDYSVSSYIVNGESFSSLYEIVNFISLGGFGVYNIVPELCVKTLRSVTVKNCCNDEMVMIVDNNKTINTYDINYMNMSCGSGELLPYEYMIIKGGDVIEDHIPIHSARDILCDNDVKVQLRCCSEDGYCEMIDNMSNPISFDNDNTTEYVDDVTIDGTLYHNLTHDDDVMLYFNVPSQYRGYVGTVINKVAVQRTYVSGVSYYDIDVNSNSPSANTAVLYDDGTNCYITVFLSRLNPGEYVFVHIGHIDGSISDDAACFDTFNFKDASFLPFVMFVTPVGTTNFGFKDSEGNEQNGIIGLYDGNKQIAGFWVKDGFGNRYLSKTDSIEINWYHNDKLELVYG